MAKLFDLPEDDVFDMLSGYADGLSAATEDKKTVVGPEDTIEAPEAKDDVTKTAENIEQDSSASIQVNVAAQDLDIDFPDQSAEIDTSDLEDGIQELSDKTDENAELLTSIDSTLKDQYEADEEDRRRSMIGEERSPFSAYLGENGEEVTPPKGGSLFDGLGGLAGLLGLGGRDRGKDKTDKRAPKSGGGNWKAKLGKLAIGAAATIAGVVGADTLLEKTGQGGISGTFNRYNPFSSDEEQESLVSNPVNAERTVTQTSDTYYPGDPEYTDNSQRLKDREKLARERQGRIAEEYSVPAEAESREENSYAPQMASLGVAGLGGLGYLAAKQGLPAFGGLKDRAVAGLGSLKEKAGGLKDRFLSKPNVPGTDLVEPSTRNQKVGMLDKVKGNAGKIKSLGAVGTAVSGVMLGSNIIDQRNQEYETDRAKNTDTARLVGTFIGDTLATLTGSAVGGVVGTAAAPGVGTVLGGAAGGIAASTWAQESGFSEAIGNATAAVYDTAASAIDSGKNFVSKVGSFFSFSRDKEEEVADKQKEVAYTQKEVTNKQEEVFTKQADLINSSQQLTDTAAKKMEDIDIKVNVNPVVPKRAGPSKENIDYANRRVDAATGGVASRFHAQDFTDHEDSYESYQKFIKKNKLKDYSLSDYSYEFNKASSEADVNNEQSNRIYAGREEADIRDSEADANLIAGSITSSMPKPEKPKAGARIVNPQQASPSKAQGKQINTQLTKPTLQTVPVIVEDATLTLMNLGHI